ALLLEDIHWADEGSLDLMDAVVQQQPDLPLLVLSASRPTLREARPTWGHGAPVTLDIELRPLTDHESRELVGQILCKVREVPAELQNLIVGHAEGSPFYVEELIKMFIEDGVITTGENTWHVVTERLRAVRVPPTLTGILQARLDGLPAPQRETLQQASVVGRVFWTDVIKHFREAGIARALRNDGASVADDLDALVTRELIFRRIESSFANTDEFIFKHGILHQVTYESVLKRLRREYHAQVATSLIAMSGERANEHAGRIGEHYEQAGAQAQAAYWYVRAGKRARDSYLLDDAISFFEKARQLWQPQADHAAEERFAVLAGLGNAYVTRARYRDAIEVLSTMCAEAEAHGNLLAQSRAWNGLASAHSNLGEHRSALGNASRAEAAARAANADVELLEALEMKGRCLFRLGHPDDAIQLGEQMLPLAHSLGAKRHEARWLNLLGAIHNSLGQYAHAEAAFADALAICDEIGDRSQAMTVLNNLGVIAEARGNFRDAFQHYYDALTGARAIGNRNSELVYLSNLGGAQVALGEYAAAEASLRQVIETAGSSGAGGLVNTYVYLAEACLHQSNLGDAVNAAQHALKLAQAREVPSYLASAWRVLGMVAAQLPEPAALEATDGAEADRLDARACFAESMRISTETHMEGERARTLRAWAAFERVRG
ncbi:MAG: tetratricopeptide repeat protein, partial [Chloroflexi bacterium]|nr:tetratricopeptide repeat protein [Chloroflexota bacterium]